MNRVRIDAKWLGLLLVCGLSAGCLQPLDIFGVETHVTKHSKLAKDTKPKDDRIEDKSPVYHPNHFIVERFGHNEVTLNKSGSVTKLDVVPFENGQEKKTFDNKLFPDRSQALAALSGLAQADIIPSMEVVNGFMKPFNDGLYAAIEMDLQQGHTAGGLLSKIDFLHKFQTALLTRWENASGLKRISLESALVFVGAALLAGDNPVTLPDTILDQAQARLDVFLLVPQFSYPIGFYTWNETLRKILSKTACCKIMAAGRTWKSSISLQPWLWSCAKRWSLPTNTNKSFPFMPVLPIRIRVSPPSTWHLTSVVGRISLS